MVEVSGSRGGGEALDRGGSLTSPRVVRELLDSAGIHPSRGMGQNFLVDANVLDIIEKAAGLSGTDTVVEVGAGLGALTGRLVERCREVFALESDARLLRLLGELLGASGNLRMIEADAVRFDLEGLWNGPPGGTVKMVSNLPYQIAATLIVDWLILYPWLAEYTVMIQREVADRMTAAPGGKDYSAATVKIQHRASATRVARVSRNCFYPRPGVDSAIVHIVRHNAGGVRDADGRDGDERLFDLAVTAAFQQRRKKLANSVSSCPAVSAGPREVAGALANLGIDPGSRAADLSPADYVALVAELGRVT